MDKAESNDKLVVVLLGKTGSGKSATGNTMLREKVFPSKCTAQSTTKSTTWGKSTNGTEIVVIDTPGVFDTRADTKAISEEITKCVGIALSHGDGIDSFVLVVSIDNRYTKEQEKSVEIFKEIFGEEMMKYVTIVFTKKDQLDEGQTLNDYLEEIPAHLAELVKQCDNRVVAFNNKTKNEEEEKSQLLYLIQTIRQAKTKNGSRPFSNALTEQMKPKIDEDRKRYEAPDKIARQCADFEMETSPVFKVILQAVVIIVTLGFERWMRDNVR